MQPAYTKIARTLFYLIALGVMTGYVIAEGGNPTVLLIYMIGTLVVYGVDHIKLEYRNLTFELGNRDTDSQTSKESDPQE